MASERQVCATIVIAPALTENISFSLRVAIVSLLMANFFVKTFFFILFSLIYNIKIQIYKIDSNLDKVFHPEGERG